MNHWSTLIMAGAAVICLIIGFAVARLTSCGQCKAVRDQQVALVGRLLGEPDIQAPARHALRRKRPMTLAETVDFLDGVGALLTPERWQEIETQRLTAHRSNWQERAIAATPHRHHSTPAGAR
jgi:hypothetical protein